MSYLRLYTQRTSHTAHRTPHILTHYENSNDCDAMRMRYDVTNRITHRHISFEHSSVLSMLKTRNRVQAHCDLDSSPFCTRLCCIREILYSVLSVLNANNRGNM